MYSSDVSRKPIESGGSPMRGSVEGANGATGGGGNDCEAVA